MSNRYQKCKYNRVSNDNPRELIESWLYSHYQSDTDILTIVDDLGEAPHLCFKTSDTSLIDAIVTLSKLQGIDIAESEFNNLTGFIKINEIKFREIEKFNDSNSLIFMAVKFTGDETYQQLTNFFSNELGISKGKNVIGVYHLSDNVYGDQGRSDYLIEFDNPEIQFNPMQRLTYGKDIKWTSDFITNFEKDYKS